MIDVWIATGICGVFNLVTYFAGYRRGLVRMIVPAYTKGVQDASDLFKREIDKMLKEKKDGE
jgi:ribonuclease I